jgi:chromosome segregation ATPase
MKIIKKNGKIYAVYKGKSFKINNIKESDLNSNIIRDLVKIVKRLTKKRKTKQRQSNTKKEHKETSLGEQVGIIKGSETLKPKVSTVDDSRLAKVLNVAVSHNENIKLEGENEKLKKEKNEKEVKDKLLPKTGDVKLLTHSGEETILKEDLYKKYMELYNDLEKRKEQIQAYIDQSIEYEEQITKLKKEKKENDEIIEKGKQYLDLLNKEIEEIKKQNVIHKKEKNRIENDFYEFKINLQNLESERDKIYEELETKQTKINLATISLKDLEKQKQQAEDKIKELEEKIEGSETKIEILEEERRKSYLMDLKQEDLVKIADDFKIKTNQDKNKGFTKSHEEIIGKIKDKDPNFNRVNDKYIKTGKYFTKKQIKKQEKIDKLKKEKQRR